MVQMPKTLLALGMIFSLFLVACSGSKPFVQRASSQKYYGGPAGSGGGTIYRVFIGKSNKSELRIDKVWVGDAEKGTWAKFQVYADSSRTVLRDHRLPKGSSLSRIEFTKKFAGTPTPGANEDTAPELPEPIPASGLPKAYATGLVIYYTQSSGKTGNWIVEELITLAPLLHP
ncbi:MAG: hypothetical protein AAGN35_03010 [Bacteroidota bacterium]